MSERRGDLPSGGTGARQEGVLAEWNDDRGFGFITPVGGGSRVFVHVSAFPRGRRPVAGSEVTFAPVRDERNRARAAQVRYAAAAPSRRRGPRGKRLAFGTAVAFSALLVGLFLLADLSVVVLAVYGVASLIAFFSYAADKEAAQQGRWRTSESTLHTMGLIGGWPGALVARHVFRHKTTKQPFRTVFWLTVIVNCVALAWFVYAEPVVLP